MKEKMRNLADKFINYETCMYLLFGVLTTAVDWLVYHLLLQTGLSYGYKTLFAWTAAVLFAFVSNKLVVFKSLDFQLKNMAKELFLFVGARIASLFFAARRNVPSVFCFGYAGIPGKGAGGGACYHSQLHIQQMLHIPER